MAISASGRGGALVRFDPAETGALVAAANATVAVMGGRAMRGWLRVSSEDCEPTSSSPSGSAGSSDTPGRFRPSASTTRADHPF